MAIEIDRGIIHMSVLTANGAEGATAEAPPHLPLSKVAAVGVGNALEFYDFLSFSFFAIQIGHTFFPVAQTKNGLLYTLATFGVGFVTRPLGGWIIGAYADRAGRKPAMMLSFALMGVAITGLALTPGYAQIGVAAPILLVMFRLIQGFALGGEVGPSTAFLIEAAPKTKRGLYVGLQYATQDLSVLVAGIVGFTLTALLSPAVLDAWGWRLAFLLGAAIVPLGLMIRRNLPETFGGDHAAGATKPSAAAHAPVFILGVIMLGAACIAYYGIEYINTYAQDTLHLSVRLAFGATIVLGAVSVAADLFGGVMTDRVGRKPVMITAAALVLVIILPAFMLLNRFPSAGVIFAVTAVLGVLSAIISSSALIAITENLPAAVRSGVLGTLYAVAMSAFGGTTQFVAKGLIVLTHNPLAPAWYITGAMAIGLVAMAMIKETAPAKVGE
jgi:MFS family permease